MWGREVILVSDVRCGVLVVAGGRTRLEAGDIVLYLVHNLFIPPSGSETGLRR
jgi:hypothetical protein